MELSVLNNNSQTALPGSPRVARRMTQAAILAALTAAFLTPVSVRASDSKRVTFDVSLYGLGVGMSGDAGVGPINVDVDVSTDKVLENLEFTGMGTVRVGYGPWAITTDVLFMGLQGSKNNFTAEFDQWMVEPTLSYRMNQYFEVLAGARYNNLSGELRGPGLIIPGGVIKSGTQEWWDPVVGANASLPLGRGFSFNVRGDVGGFGAGSDFAWQAFPYVSWRFAEWASVEGGYRWLYMDYETGSGADRFKYDVLNQGPQVGITFHF